MNLFQVSTLLTAIISILLGFFVYLSNRRAKVNIAWFITALVISLWSLGLLGVISSTQQTTALLWQNLLDVTGVLVPITFFNFVLYLLGLENKYKRQKFFSWIIGILLILFSFTSLFKHGIAPEFGFNFWIQPGPFYFLFPLEYLFYVFFSLFLLIKCLKESTDETLKMQARYVLGALILGFGGGVTNFFPQTFNIYPVGNYLVVLYVFFISYAIFRHHLFNVKVVATQLLTFGICIFLLIKVLLAETGKDLFIDGSLLALVFFFGILLVRSVTKEVEQREKMEKLTQKLETANVRLKQLDEAKSEFLSIASHQLRTPLTSIKGLVSMLLEGFWGPVNEEQKKYLNEVSQSGNRLLGLIEELLDISRIEAGRLKFNFQATDLVKLTKGMINTFETQAADKKLYLRFNEPEFPTALVNADPQKIEQVVQNLIDNAIKYTDKGGAEINIKQEDNQVVFSIKDTGMGISKEQQPLLFGKFQRGQTATSQHTEGAGLGLYWANKVTRAHNGRIWGESAGRDKGSTFYFSLPVA